MGIFSSHEEDHGEALQKANNDGQTDASNEVYHRPFYHTPFDGLILSERDMEEMDEINEAYDKGHSHTESQQQKGGCFLTTACIRAAGLPDNCRELTVLRHFRDTFVQTRDDGGALIREYYDQSPRIVEKLSEAELKSIYATVQIAVAKIDRGEFDGALSIYAEMFRELHTRHPVEIH